VPLAVCIVACAVLLLATSPAAATFGFSVVDGALSDELGMAHTEAGGHPHTVSVSFQLNRTINAQGHVEPDGGALRDLRVDMPAGLIGVPHTVPRCARPLRVPSQVDAIDAGVDPSSICSASSIVGVATVTISADGIERAFAPVFNVEPPPGKPAQFAFNFLGQLVYLDTELRGGSDHGVSIEARNLTQVATAIGASVTLWGVPADRSHDAQRCLAFLLIEASPRCDDFGGLFPRLGPTPAGVPPTPFLTNPTRCTNPGEGLLFTLSATSWSAGGGRDEQTFVTHGPPGFPLPADQWGRTQGLTGCEGLTFEPSVLVRPHASAPDSPTGLSIDLDFR
jgi:hypothetical protein